ncbi:hypothetical protein C8Q76DRAFT_629737, partial [Earliella scabrosa]
LRGVVTGVIYPVCRGRPRLIRLPLNEEIIGHTDPALPWPEDVDVRHWFPHGARYTRITCVPGSDFALYNDYTVITSASPRRSPVNSTVYHLLGLYLRGNVVVVKHSARRLLRVCNIHHAETRFVDLLIQR